MTIEKETRTLRSGVCVLPQLLTGKCKKVDVEYKNGARYHGQVCGNRRSGHGIFTWPNGAHYDGEFVDNKRQGNGVQEWPDGSRYEGEFVEDYRHGSGRHTWPSGEVYEGNFYKDRRHGYGVYTWPDGSQFSGTFYTDKKEGYGTFMFANGSKFEGLYKDDEREGPGLLTHSDGKRDVGLWHREHLVKLCKSVNGAEFSLESHGYSPQLHEHRTRLSKSAAVGRRQEIIKSFVALQSSPEPLDYEFEPDPETVLRGVVSDLLPSCSLAADIYLYDKAFFAAASDRKSSGIVSNCQENEDAASKQMDKETLNNVNSKIQEKSKRISSGKEKSSNSAMSGKRMGASSAKSSSKPLSAASNGTENDDDKVLAWNNTPSCIAMQTNVLRHRCSQNSVSFDVEAMLSGERTGNSGDFGPIENVSERLIFAAGAGDLATVARLLEAGEACVDVADVRGRTPLFAAAVNCHHNVINYLLDNGADVNKLDDEGLSALSACFVFLYPQESFLDNAADGIFAKPIEPTPATKSTAAAKNTRAGKTGKKLPPPRREPSKLDTKMIKELREEYGNAAQEMPDASNLKDKEDLLRAIDSENFPDGGIDEVESRLGTLSFQRAARSSSVEELINGGEPAAEASCVASTDAMSSKLSQFESHRTANSLPVNVSDRQIVKCATILSKNDMIIDRARSANRDVWSEGTVRRLALEKSKRQQMKATTHLLLKRGANPNASSVPMPALFFAVKCGDVETVRLLLDKGANPGSMLPESMCCLAPLHFSCGLLCKEGIEITKLLLNALADPDVRALEDDSFIDHFLEEDWSKDELSVENIEILGGRTPLHVACARQDSYENACEIVRLLLSHRANTRVLCNGHSPLTLAITRGNDLAVQVLLSSGADPNLEHSHGIGSALCAATFTDNESRRSPDARIALIDRLIIAGANVLAPIAIGPRRLIGTVVDYANYVYNLDQRVGHVPYHALTVPERETFNARRSLLEHVGHLVRMQAVEQERERIREEEKSGKISRNPSAGFVYTGHGARLESALLQQRRKPNSAASSFLSDTDVRKPLFRYCYECGRSVNVRLTPCPRCKEVYYCSKPCQNKAWATVHKDECLRLPQEGRKSGRGTSPGRGFAGEHSLERDGKGGGIYGRDVDGGKRGKDAADVDELEDKLQLLTFERRLEYDSDLENPDDIGHFDLPLVTNAADLIQRMNVELKHSKVTKQRKNDRGQLVGSGNNNGSNINCSYCSYCSDASDDEIPRVENRWNVRMRHKTSSAPAAGRMSNPKDWMEDQTELSTLDSRSLRSLLKGKSQFSSLALSSSDEYSSDVSSNGETGGDGRPRHHRIRSHGRNRLNVGSDSEPTYTKDRERKTRKRRQRHDITEQPGDELMKRHRKPGRRKDAEDFVPNYMNIRGMADASDAALRNGLKPRQHRVKYSDDFDGEHNSMMRKKSFKEGTRDDGSDHHLRKSGRMLVVSNDAKSERNVNRKTAEADGKLRGKACSNNMQISGVKADAKQRGETLRRRSAGVGRKGLTDMVEIGTLKTLRAAALMKGNSQFVKLKANSSLFPIASWKDNLPENCYVGNYSYI